MAVLPYMWYYRVSATTAWLCLSMMWLGEISSLTRNFYPKVAACTTAQADTMARYTLYFSKMLCNWQHNIKVWLAQYQYTVTDWNIKFWSTTSIPVWQHVKLSRFVPNCPDERGTLGTAINQPTNQLMPYSSLGNTGQSIWYWHSTCSKYKWKLQNVLLYEALCTTHLFHF